MSLKEAGTLKELVPQEVSQIMLAFSATVRHLMPESVPDDYPNRRKWVDWQNEWFFKGLTSRPDPKPGIDQDKAMRHLGCIQGSFEPKHEDKEAAVAYLASLWFEEPK